MKPPSRCGILDKCTFLLLFPSPLPSRGSFTHCHHLERFLPWGNTPAFGCFHDRYSPKNVTILVHHTHTHADLSLIKFTFTKSEIKFTFTKSEVWLSILRILYSGSRNRQIPGDHWTASLAQSTRFRPVEDPVSRNKMAPEE